MWTVPLVKNQLLPKKIKIIEVLTLLSFESSCLWRPLRRITHGDVHWNGGFYFFHFAGYRKFVGIRLFYPAFPLFRRSIQFVFSRRKDRGLLCYFSLKKNWIQYEDFSIFVQISNVLKKL